jgi:hypothetical protein
LALRTKGIFLIDLVFGKQNSSSAIKKIQFGQTLSGIQGLKQEQPNITKYSKNENEKQKPTYSIFFFESHRTSN